MQIENNLERRIAAALSNEGIASHALSELLEATNAAIVEAERTVEEERERALDPALSPDLATARNTMEDAVFAAQRLRTLQPRLQKSCAHARYVEACARWAEQYETVKAKRDAAAEELRARYPTLLLEIATLQARVQAIDNEITNVNRDKPTAIDEPRDPRPALQSTAATAARKATPNYV